MTKRGRAAIPVNQHILTQAIKDAEKDGPLSNQKEVWEKSAELYNAKCNPKKPLSHSIVALRAKSWSIQIQTPSGKGRRGPMSAEHKAKFIAARGKRVSKAEKFEQSESAQEALSLLESQVPARWHNLVDAARNGSRTAAVKLKCLDCSAYQTPEIRKCHIKACPLWLFRPYQGSLEPDEDQEAEEVEADA